MKFNVRCSRTQLQYFLRKTTCLIPQRSVFTCAVLDSDNYGAADCSMKRTRPIEDYFLDSRVQSILVKITGLDYNKIYRPARQTLSTPHYEFATDERLKELQSMAKVNALKKLQIPPVMDVREPVDEVMAYDPEVQGLMTANLVFIDISQNIPERERFVSVREPDGTLRKGNWDERFRMNQIYCPTPGRKLIVPKLFESPYLDRLLDEESYIFILDISCVQFEPDDPEYHRVTHTTYDHINSRKKFDELRSTRHFGAMAFYFAWKQKIEGLLIDMIERNMMGDASDLVKLFCILNDVSVKDVETKTEEEIVTEFIAQNTSASKPGLEMAFQTYIEMRRNAERSEDTALQQSSASS